MGQPQHVVDEDRPVHVGLGEAVAFRVQFRVRRLLAHAQRVEVGGKVAADAVGADDHQRADRVDHGALELRLGQVDALFGGLAAIF
ncbi:hypothetical protein MASR1M65_04080 [Saprospiraceae bacterium]